MGMTAEVINAETIPFERSRDDQAWARWLARSADGLLITPIVFVLFATLGVAIELGRAPAIILEWTEQPVLAAAMEIVAAFMVFALWEPLFLSNTGTTPGKWIMGISVRTRDGAKLSLPRALARFVTVWFVGLGAGIPLLSLVTMLMARAKLINDGVTGWDEQLDCVVEHRKRHPIVWALVIVTAIGVTGALRFAERSGVFG
jgi:uncharacterized RDD family membrane protein YckC